MNDKKMFKYCINIYFFPLTGYLPRIDRLRTVCPGIYTDTGFQDGIHLQVSIAFQTDRSPEKFSS